MAQREFILKSLGLISEEDYDFFYNQHEHKWLEEEKRWIKIDVWWELERQNKAKTSELIEEFKGEINSEWAKKIRLEFLDREIERLNSEIKTILRDYKEAHFSKNSGINQAIARVFLELKGFEEKERLLKRYYYAKNELNGNHKKGNGVTQEMIERAKSYPFSELLEVNRNKFALCPFHEDSGPSLYTKGNYGFCFGCGFSGDIIKFLMNRDEIGFVEAVKKLCSR